MEIIRHYDVGMTYFPSVQGPDGKYWWVQCPECDAVVLSKDGRGHQRHYDKVHNPDTISVRQASREIDRLYAHSPDVVEAVMRVVEIASPLGGPVRALREIREMLS